MYNLALFEVKKMHKNFVICLLGKNLGEVNVKEHSFENAPIYKVWIGPLDSVAQADTTVAKITELGHKEYKLVFQDKP